MGKEKHATVEASKKERTFYYEIIGIIALIVAMIAIARLGTVGLYLMLAFRLLFGDWYFIFIILLALFGLYCLLFHKRIDIKNVRYVGVILIVLSLLILSHFSMHHYVKNYDSNYYVLCLNLYFDYFKNTQGDMMVGGGIIGASFFYLFYYMFSSIGTWITSLLMLFIGVVFLSKKTVKEFFQTILHFFKKFFGGAKWFSGKIKRGIKKLDEDLHHDNVPEKQSNQKVKKPKATFFSMPDHLFLEEEQKHMQSIKKALLNALHAMNLYEIKIEDVLCHHISVFFIRSYQKISFDLLYMNLNKSLVDPFLIRYDSYQDQVVVEVNNLHPRFLSIKEALPTDKVLHYTIGIDDRNQMVQLDGHLMLTSSKDDASKRYLTSITLFPIIQEVSPLKVMVLDLAGFLAHMKPYVARYETDTEQLNAIVEEADQILQKLSDAHVTNIEKYNQMSPNQMLPYHYIVLTGMENIIDEPIFSDKLQYLLRVGKAAGYLVVGALQDHRHVSTNFLNAFDYKLILEQQFQVSKELIGWDAKDILQTGIEGFLKYRDLIIRISLLKLSQDEWEKLFLRQK